MSGGPDRFVSKTLWRSRPGRPGSYIVRISGRPNWESTPIEITAGETTRVTPDLYLPCQITIRILDSAGQPLPGAVLTRRTRPYVFYGFRGDGPAVESGMQNIAGQDGCVALSEMRAGKHRFLVEANGYDPQTLEFDLTAGELRDGGIVYLSKAKCRVVVKLKGMRENQAYIFPMPDHKEELAEYFEEVLADYRDYPEDPGYDERIKIEAMRRAGYKAARDAARTAT